MTPCGRRRFEKGSAGLPSRRPQSARTAAKAFREGAATTVRTRSQSAKWSASSRTKTGIASSSTARATLSGVRSGTGLGRAEIAHRSFGDLRNRPEPITHAPQGLGNGHRTGGPLPDDHKRSSSSSPPATTNATRPRICAVVCCSRVDPIVRLCRETSRASRRKLCREATNAAAHASAV